MRSTSTRRSSKVTRGACAASPSSGTMATPPGPRSPCGRSGAAGCAAPATNVTAAATPNNPARALPQPRVMDSTPAAAAGDARAQSAAGEPRLDLIADAHRRRVREQHARRAGHDGEAARQRGQRAHGAERTPGEIQAVLRARHRLARGALEPRAQQLMPLALRLQPLQRRAAHEARATLAHAAARMVQAAARRAGETLRQIVEALHL